MLHSCPVVFLNVGNGSETENGEFCHRGVQVLMGEVIRLVRDSWRHICSLRLILAAIGHPVKTGCSPRSFVGHSERDVSHGRLSSDLQPS